MNTLPNEVNFTKLDFPVKKQVYLNTKVVSTTQLDHNNIKHDKKY